MKPYYFHTKDPYINYLKRINDLKENPANKSINEKFPILLNYFELKKPCQ